MSRTERESEEHNKKKNRAAAPLNHSFSTIKIKKIGPPAPLSHSFPTTILKKSVLSHQHRLHDFKHTNRNCFPFRFYFNTKKCINTQRQDSKSPELPPPTFDPPAATFRRGTYCLAYALTLAIVLCSISFDISVIITHFLVTPYSCKSSMCAKDFVPLSLQWNN